MNISNAKHIIVALEKDQDNGPAMQRATLLANGGDLKVDLIYCCYNSFLEHNLLLNEQERQASKEEYLTEQQQWLHRVLTDFKRICPTAIVNARVLYGANSTSELLGEADRCNAELLIKTPARHQPLKELILQQQDWELIRQCQKPLWIPQRAHLDGKVLACIDPLHSADPEHTRDLKILNTAQQLSTIIDKPLQVLHCFTDIPHGLLFDSDPMEKNNSDHSGSHIARQQVIVKLLEPLHISTSQLMLLEGRPEVIIRQLAKKPEFSTIVLGATSRGILDRATIGNTAERLLHSVNADLLLCTPESC